MAVPTLPSLIPTTKRPLSVGPPLTEPAFFSTAFMGYACEWSPFEPTKLAIATAQHFGIVGNGRQHVIEVDFSKGALSSSSSSTSQSSPYQKGPFRDLGIYNTRDGVFDCCWSEKNEGHIISACGDGKLRLWDLKAPRNPLRAYEGHTSEVMSCDWNLVSKDHFISGSWDKTVRLWDPVSARCLGIFAPHKGLVYHASWAPHDANVFASVSEDQHLSLSDVRSGGGLSSSTMMKSASAPILTTKAHDHEILTCDWNKYDRNIIATGSCDRRIKVWDLRKLSTELCQLNAHRYAVRRLRFSPHIPTQLTSVAYDMNTVVWDYSRLPNPIIAQCKHHNEFAVGLAYNLFHRGLVATTGWDQKVAVYNLDSGLSQSMAMTKPT